MVKYFPKVKYWESLEKGIITIKEIRDIFVFKKYALIKPILIVIFPRFLNTFSILL